MVDVVEDEELNINDCDLIIERNVAHQTQTSILINGASKASVIANYLTVVCCLAYESTCSCGEELHNKEIYERTSNNFDQVCMRVRML